MQSFKPWFEAWHFAAQAQQVMSLRMMRFWTNDATAGASEKVAAAAEAQLAVGVALLKGETAATALRRAAIPYRRRVSANHRRLS